MRLNVNQTSLGGSYIRVNRREKCLVTICCHTAVSLFLTM